MRYRKKLMRNNWVVSLVRSVSNWHNQGTLSNVFIFSMPRSGSTWLMELIWSQPSFKYVNEPFNLKGGFIQKKSGIEGFHELYNSKAKDKVVDYIDSFVRGEAGYLNPNPLRKNYRLRTNRIVFKIIHGGELFINDIANECNGKIVYLIRNPISVALSRQQLPRLKVLGSKEVVRNFSPSQRDLISRIYRGGTDMEKRIVAWCIQNKLALMLRTSDWLVLSYEELSLRPERVIESLANHCDLPRKDIMLKSVNVPSAVTSQSHKVDVQLMRGGQEERFDLIRKWRDRVSDEEAERYFEICREMNFEVYNKDSDLPSSDFLVGFNESSTINHMLTNEEQG